MLEQAHEPHTRYALWLYLLQDNLVPAPTRLTLPMEPPMRAHLEHLDLSHLRTFIVVAEQGSLSAAARQLDVSQPALSRIIRALEERLQTTLLERHRRGVSLTAAGDALLQGARQVLRLMHQTEEIIGGLETEEVGRFTLGCHGSLGAYFLPGFFALALQRLPRIEIALIEGSSARIQEAVVQREAHFGLAVNPTPHPDLIIRPLFRDAVRVFLRADLAATAGITPDVPPHDAWAMAAELLRRGPIIYAGRIWQCREILEVLRERGIYPERELDCGDLELIKSLTLAGVGVGILPERVARYHHEGALTLLHPELPQVPDTIALLYRADRHRTRGFQSLRDALMEHGQHLARGDAAA